MASKQYSGVVLSLAVLLIGCGTQPIVKTGRHVDICSGRSFMRYAVDSIAVYVLRSEDTVINRDLVPLLERGVLRGEWLKQAQAAQVMNNGSVPQGFIAEIDKCILEPSASSPRQCKDSLYFDGNGQRYYSIQSARREDPADPSRIEIQADDGHTWVHFNVVLKDGMIQVLCRGLTL